MGSLDPVLVVADNATIAAWAPDWAEAFDACGWTFRVRLFTTGQESDGHEAIIDEARNLGARAIVAAGGETLAAAAGAAATALGLPLVRALSAASSAPRL